MNDNRKRPTLAACLIVKDEQERLPEALASVAFCDEVVVVDSGSCDNTVAIARAAGARVVEHPWSGFAVQRNVALAHATADWVLELDADERITPLLAQSIGAFLADPPEGVEVVALPRADRFLGRRLTAANQYPNYRFRLMRRTSLRHDESRRVHEGVRPRGRAWALEGDIDHILADTLREAASDLVTYSRLTASQFVAPPNLGGALFGVTVRPVMKFGYRLVVLGGWRDGWEGVAWIARECLSDALVWLIALSAWRSRRGGVLATRGPWHFEGEYVPADWPRVVAVARGAVAARRSARWLSRAREAGFETTLITEAAVPSSDMLRVHRLAAFTPLGLVRALEAERQLRMPVAVAGAGRLERLLLRAGPARLRGRRDPLTLSDDPPARRG